MAPFFAGLGILVTGCSTVVGEDTAGTTTSSAAEVTTAEEAEDTTTTDEPVVTSRTTEAPTPVPDGSGCNPGDGLLQDGTWFGFVEAAYADALDLDLACRFSDENALLAQMEDGEGPEVYDYYVRNDSPTIRTLLVDPEVPVAWHPSDGPTPETTTYSNWAAQEGRMFGIWITIEQGRVTAIDEQWVP